MKVIECDREKARETTSVFCSSRGIDLTIILFGRVKMTDLGLAQKRARKILWFPKKLFCRVTYLSICTVYVSQ